MKSYLSGVEPDVRSNCELNTINEEVERFATETHVRKMTEFDEIILKSQRMNGMKSMMMKKVI